MTVVEESPEVKVVRRKRPQRAYTLSPEIIAEMDRHTAETGESRARLVERALWDFLRKCEDTPQGVGF